MKSRCSWEFRNLKTANIKSLASGLGSFGVGVLHGDLNDYQKELRRGPHYSYNVALNPIGPLNPKP